MVLGSPPEILGLGPRFVFRIFREFDSCVASEVDFHVVGLDVFTLCLGFQFLCADGGSEFHNPYPPPDIASLFSLCALVGMCAFMVVQSNLAFSLF